MIEYVTLKKFCEMTGYTPKACRTKIYKGDWILNRVYRKAPDGHIMINLEEFNRWVETGMVSEKRQAAPTKSPLPFAVYGVEKGSSSCPRPLT